MAAITKNEKESKMTYAETKAPEAPTGFGLPEEMLNELVAMLEYMRPAGSKAEQDFIARFIAPLDPYEDEAGNLWVTVGENPETLWSCHTDTVHKKSGKQHVLISDDGFIFCHPKGKGKPNCLGADCTTGVWLMVNMIRRGKTGVYVFHAAEEIGCVGSSHIATKTPERLEGIKHAIAFDRYGYNSVITHQASGRCCSDAFANSLAAQLNEMGGTFELDPGGVYTDTNEYRGLIPECTNLSVGYFHQHSSAEEQSIEFLGWLLPALLCLDTTRLTVERNPAEPDDDDYYSRYWGFSPRRSYNLADDDLFNFVPNDTRKYGYDEIDAMRALVEDDPDIIAEILLEYGLTPQTLAEEIYQKGGMPPF